MHSSILGFKNGKEIHMKYEGFVGDSIRYKLLICINYLIWIYKLDNVTPVTCNTILYLL